MDEKSENTFEQALRQTLREGTPPRIDAIIREAIRSNAAKRPIPSHAAHFHFRRWAAAAGIVAALGIGSWFYERGRGAAHDPAYDESDIMLEIIGLASVNSVSAVDECIDAEL